MTLDRLLLVLALSLAPALAHAQDSVLQGTCENLVVADQDLLATCKGSLVRLSSPNFSSFAFSTTEGRTLSFTGKDTQDLDGGAQLPVTLVAPGLTNKDGISRSPTPATGTCRVATPEPHSMAVTCEATAQGKHYSGSFLARKSDASATKP